MTDFYQFTDGRVEPCSPAKWCERVMSGARRVDLTPVGCRTVSTVFVGKDDGGGGGGIFQTIVFIGANLYDNDALVLHEYTSNYATLGAAKQGHWVIVDRLRSCE